MLPARKIVDFEAEGFEDALRVASAYADTIEQGKLPGPEHIPLQLLPRGFERDHSHAVIDALRSMAIAQLLRDRVAWALHVARAQVVYALAVSGAYLRTVPRA